jgi:hypothetical protein
MKRLSPVLFAVSALWGPSLLAQQSAFGGTNVTGQLVLRTTVNALQQAQLAQAQAQTAASIASVGAQTLEADLGPSINPRMQMHFPAPQVPPRIPFQPLPSGTSLPIENVSAMTKVGVVGRGWLNPDSSPVAGTSSSGFMGLTHLDQRNANKGNQLNVEPPSQGLAVGNGYILEGVNDAIQVYDMSGNPLLPVPISTNQLFGLPPVVDRSTLVFGPNPTDIRAFYDQGINRFFVIQRIQANDGAGSPLPQSEEIIAVSQTGDPTGTYNIYTIDTTDSTNPFCPCVADYPQIGADQYAFYIAANEFHWFTGSFAKTANILAISRTALASGASAPSTVSFKVRFSTGYEFAIQPATTPPGSSNFLAAGGVEYFVSGLASSSDSNLALWAMVNTSSINSANPSLTLFRTIVPTETYLAPSAVSQKNGTLTYGSTLHPPGTLPFIDGGDPRVLSVNYAGGRLYVTLATELQDDNLNSVVGAAYMVISPTYRAGTLAGAALRQGYVLTNSENLLRPAMTLNSQGQGAIVFTLVGPDYYPSAAFVPFTIPSPTPASPAPFVLGPSIQLAGVGASPEDGFTGYPGPARWGDYSAAVVNGGDGSILMGTEYIPNAPRAQKANWGTYLMHYKP